MRKISMKNEKGFTLVEVMVTAALMGGLALVGMQMTKNISRSQKNMSQKNEILAIEQRILASFQNKTSCTATITDVANNLGSTTALTNIYGNLGTVIYTVGAVYGSGDSRVSIKSIELTTVSPGTVIIGSSLPVKRMSTGQIKVIYTKGDATGGTTNETTQKSSSEGSVDKVKTYDIMVEANDATTALIGCYATTDTSACNSLGGTYNSTNGRCENIEIFDNTVNSNTPNAIIAQGSMRIKDNLAIGTTALSTSPRLLILSDPAHAGATDPSVSISSTSSNLQIAHSGDYVSLYNTIASGGLQFMNAAGTGSILHLQSATGNVGVGTVTPSTKLEVAGNILLASGVTNPVLSFSTATGAYLTSPVPNALSLGTNATERVRIDAAGNVGIGVAAPAYKLDVNSSLNVSGTGGSPGVITIQNQSVASSEFGNISATKLTEVPTKRWVQEQIARLFATTSPETLNGVAQSFATYAASNTLDIIKRAVCETSYVKVTATGSPTVGVYSSSRCDYDVSLTMPDCTIAGRCIDIYATTVHANAICNTSMQCSTAFARYRCPDGYWMYGIANGFPLCKLNGIGSPSVPWHTVSPNPY